jgi:hypothetical protein
MRRAHRFAEVLNSEEGHGLMLLAAVIAGGGIVALGIGAASDEGWLAVAGGVVGGLGIVGYNAVRHITLDWEIFRRFDGK